MLTGNTEFNSRAAATDQAPVYFVKVDGITGEHYSTAPVYNELTTKVVLLGLPQLTQSKLDLLDGSTTVARLRLPFFDVDGAASELFGQAAAGAPVSTWKNRQLTLWGGYRDLRESDYVQLFTGRVVALRLATAGSYELELADESYQLEGEIMTAAEETKPTTITGNVVNVLVSILRGVFSASGDWPLDSISVASGSSSAPTGLGIADADLDLAGMMAERDRWRPDDTVQLEFQEPEDGRDYLNREFFRAFQARRQGLGGQLGFRFVVPAMPVSAAHQLSTEQIELVSWEQLLDDHLNQFTIRGDHVIDGNSFSDLAAEVTAEDSADQTATAETVEYLVESRWLRAAHNGEVIAHELVGRLRQLWLGCPAYVRLAATFTERRLQAGDVVAVTHPDVPNQLTGERGVTDRLMTVLSAQPDLHRGRIVLDCLDAGLRKYGVIAPSATNDYPSATDLEINTFGFVTNSSGTMADGSAGCRLI